MCIHIVSCRQAESKSLDTSEALVCMHNGNDNSTNSDWISHKYHRVLGITLHKPIVDIYQAT